ncbi:DUF4157 domain-containing protein [uncultured Paracoccus sp.]|uniref:eCIS core domain-containing protein n=1 Tax=uncultured Paracoccus sp. TaxID=189685 RepID=UPI002637D30E|nr:DUF4157 domain-containing protein [uncultured Paracoccus sp.]
MRAHAAVTADTSPAVIRRSCACHAQTASDDLCPDCAAKAAGVQPRLAVGPVDDPFEREADAMAEAVVAGRPAPALNHGVVPALQPKAVATPHQSAAPAAAGAVAQGGRPLSGAERAYFEPRFGRDFSHVRLHDDARAGQAARAIGARAYTLRNHIAFGAGQFAPGTREGQRLMAHELTHTLQQSGATLRRLPIDLLADQPFEGSVDQGFGMPRPGGGQKQPGRLIMTYAEARALMECQKVMGFDDIAKAECAATVLGVPVPEWKTVPGISSPVPFRAGVAATGEATTRIGTVNLTILPDTRSTDAAMTNGAKTEINLSPLPAGMNFVDWVVSPAGTISSFTFNQDVFSMSIQTTYGPGASAGGTSGYGRGTTTEDKASTQTSTLGFHEGEHGRDFITHLQNNPYPVFAGKTGQAAATFSTHVTNFSAAITAYIKTMARISELRTDCAGKSIDTSNAEKGKVTTMCIRKPGDPTP